MTDDIDKKTPRLKPGFNNRNGQGNVDIPAPDMDSGYQLPRTDMMEAIENHDFAKVKELVDNGADVNEKTAMGQTALHYAAYKGNAGIASYLISKGASVNEANDTGATVLK